MNKTEKRDFYTYNLKQAEFFIQSGLIPKKIDTHRATKKVFFQFTRNDELENVLLLWLKGKK